MKERRMEERECSKKRRGNIEDEKKFEREKAETEWDKR
jgi:hypothetical protein